MRQSWKSTSLALTAAAGAHLALFAVPWLDFWPETSRTEPAMEVELQAITPSPAAAAKPASETTRQVTTAGSSERQVAKPQDAPSRPEEHAPPSRPEPAVSQEVLASAKAPTKISKPKPPAEPTSEKAPRVVEQPASVAATERMTTETPRRQPRKSTAGTPAAPHSGATDGENGPTSAPIAGTGNRAEIRQGYRKTLEAHLARHQQYPAMARMRRQQGTITVAFTIDHQGRLLSSKLLGRTPFPLLNREALALIERAAPFPNVPTTLEGDDLHWELPVHFRLP